MANAEQLERYLLSLINADRAAAGAPPLVLEQLHAKSAGDQVKPQKSAAALTTQGRDGGGGAVTFRFADGSGRDAGWIFEMQFDAFDPCEFEFSETANAEDSAQQIEDHVTLGVGRAVAEPRRNALRFA